MPKSHPATDPTPAAPVAAEPTANIRASTVTKPQRLANGLVYVNADMPGISRVKSGASFRYRDAGGSWLRDADEIARINRLAIPPAYTGVWVCSLHNGHLQATGMDARGRKQYRYHAEWRAMKDGTKFERLEAFGRALPRIRARVARDLKPVAGEPLSRTLVLATLVRLLDTTYVRIGNEEYAATNGSFGLTTLRNRHAAVDGATLKLKFRGKSGVQQETALNDPRVAKVVRRCQQLPGQTLFQYEDAVGAPHSLSSSDVNDYLRTAAGIGEGEDGFTAKDFRTWHGTVQALELTRLACSPAGDAVDGATADAAASRYSAKDILTAVAKQLGNTPAVCKKAYVHPAVLTLGGTLATDPGGMQAIWGSIGARSDKPTGKLRAAEQRLLTFLHEHRRREARAARASSTSSSSVRPARTPRAAVKKGAAQPAPSARRTASGAMTTA